MYLAHCQLCLAIFTTFLGLSAGRVTAARKNITISFLVDTKSSMYDDFPFIKDALIEMAKKFFHGDVKNAKSTPVKKTTEFISEFMLIPFHLDDAVEFKTSDVKELELFLQSVVIDAGDECHADTLSAIDRAVESSKAGSLIFVFTESPARDLSLLSRIKARLLGKHCRVIFMLSQHCERLNHPGYAPYIQLAEATNGIVLYYEKPDTGLLMKYIGAAIQPSAVDFVASDYDKPVAKLHQFTVDKLASSILISVAGDDKVEVKIKDPSGKREKLKGAEQIVKLPNTIVRQLTQPEAGKWTVFVKASSGHSLRVHGTSSVGIEFGFSLRKDHKEGSLRLLPQPILGTTNFLYANLVEDRMSFSLISSVKLLSTSGEVLASHTVKGPQAVDGYFVVELKPPKEAFRLLFTGLTEDAVEFTRLSSNLIQAKIPDPPKVYINPGYETLIGRSLPVYCNIRSDVPFTVTWLKEGISLDKPINYLVQALNASLLLPALSLEESGIYTCSASNIGGTSTATTEVVVRMSAPFVEPIANQSVLLGEDAVLRCDVYSFGMEQVSITWLRNGQPVRPSNRVQITSNFNLWLQGVVFEDEAEYACSAANSGGVTVESFHLKVYGAAVAKVVPDVYAFREGETVTLTCLHVSQGIPPKKWFKRGLEVLPTPRISFPSPSVLQIQRMKREDQGEYSCLVDYSQLLTLYPQQPYQARSNLYFLSRPSVNLSPREVTVKLGEPATLQCLANGYPLPTVSWSRDDTPVASSERLKLLPNGILFIPSTNVEDSGRYRCKAVNGEGMAAGFSSLLVGMKPVIQESERRTIKAALGSNVTISCRVTGSPRPVVLWLNREDQAADINDNIIKSTSDDLIIRELGVRETGKYFCKAQNQFGTATVEVLLTATGVATPLIFNPEISIHHGINGSSVKLPCKNRGNPPPSIVWFRQDLPLAPYGVKYEIKDDGSLNIKDLTPADTGSYQCRASNYAGVATADRQVFVNVPPIFNLRPSPVIEVMEAEALRLQCFASGIPEPLLTWKQDGNILPQLGNMLYVEHVDLGDNGTYECIAENDAGEARAKFDVIVKAFVISDVGQETVNVNNKIGDRPLESPKEEVPRFTKVPQAAVIDAGGSAIFECKAEGYPPPVIKWERSIIEQSVPLTILPNGNLIIRDARVEDSGPYSCLAENDVGTIMTVFKVTVKVDGGFSTWNEWTKCSVTCGVGVQERQRYCNNPPPRNGGAPCQGPAVETRPCQLKPCKVDGKFGPWRPWSRCTVTCGGGLRYRVRLCNSPKPAGGGLPCSGSSFQSEPCGTEACPGDNDIREVIGSISGSVNGIPFKGGALMVTVAYTAKANTFDVQLKELPLALLHVMRSVTTFMTPIYWSVVRPEGSENGIDITNGKFTYRGDVKYGTSQVLSIKWQVKVIPGNQVLMIETEISGEAQLFPKSLKVAPLDFKEDFIQVSKGLIYGFSENFLLVGKQPVKFSVNHTITYEGKGKMSKLARSYKIREIVVDTKEEEKSVNLKFSSSAGSGRDTCPFGFIRKDSYCSDVNECERSQCEQMCVNTYGSYQCQCTQGYYLSQNGFSCEDIDECLHDIDDCKENQECFNVLGGYECKEKFCKSGYERDPRTKNCVDINECFNEHACHSEETCINTKGSFSCILEPCKPGFERNKEKKCVDIDECKLPDICKKDETCINTPGSYQCATMLCQDGFRRKNGTCQDVDECSQVPGPCALDFLCINLPGTYQCLVKPCSPGYTRDANGQCLDIDECAKDLDDCSKVEMCENLPGSFRCKPVPCSEGYYRNAEEKCTDIDECAAVPGPCALGEICENRPGSYKCTMIECNTGYEFNDNFTACVDVDECSMKLDNCKSDEDCRNTYGSFICKNRLDQNNVPRTETPASSNASSNLVNKENLESKRVQLPTERVSVLTLKLEVSKKRLTTLAPATKATTNMEGTEHHETEVINIVNGQEKRALVTDSPLIDQNVVPMEAKSIPNDGGDEQTIKTETTVQAPTDLATAPIKLMTETLSDSSTEIPPAVSLHSHSEAPSNELGTQTELEAKDKLTTMTPPITPLLTEPPTELPLTVPPELYTKAPTEKVTEAPTEAASETVISVKPIVQKEASEVPITNAEIETSTNIPTEAVTEPQPLSPMGVAPEAITQATTEATNKAADKTHKVSPDEVPTRAATEYEIDPPSQVPTNVLVNESQGLGTTSSTRITNVEATEKSFKTVPKEPRSTSTASLSMVMSNSLTQGVLQPAFKANTDSLQVSLLKQTSVEAATDVPVILTTDALFEGTTASPVIVKTAAPVPVVTEALLEVIKAEVPGSKSTEPQTKVLETDGTEVPATKAQVEVMETNNPASVTTETAEGTVKTNAPNAVATEVPLVAVETVAPAPVTTEAPATVMETDAPSPVATEAAEGTVKTNAPNAVATEVPLVAVETVAHAPVTTEAPATVMETDAPAPVTTKAATMVMEIDLPSSAPTEAAAAIVETNAPAPVATEAPAVLVETNAPVSIATEAAAAAVVETDAPTPVVTEAPAAILETDAPAPVTTEAPAAVVETDALAPVVTEAPAAVVETDALAPVPTEAAAGVVETDAPTPVATEAPATVIETDLPSSAPTEAAAAILETDAPTPVVTEAPAAILETDAPAPVTTEAPAAVVETDALAPVVTEAPAAVVETDAPTSVVTEAPAAILETDAPAPITTEAPAAVAETDALAPVVTEAPAAVVETDAPTSVVTEAPAAILETDAPAPITTEAQAAVVETDAPTPVVTEAPAAILETDAPAPITTEAPAAVVETDAPTPVTTEAPAAVVETDAPTPVATEAPAVVIETDAPSPVETEAPLAIVETDAPTSVVTEAPAMVIETDAPTPVETEAPLAVVETDAPTPVPTEAPAVVVETDAPTPITTTAADVAVETDASTPVETEAQLAVVETDAPTSIATEAPAVVVETDAPTPITTTAAEVAVETDASTPVETEAQLAVVETDAPTSIATEAPAVVVETDAPTPITTTAAEVAVETDASTPFEREAQLAVVETDAPTPVATKAPAVVIETNTPTPVETEAPLAVLKTDAPTSVATEAAEMSVETDAPAAIVTEAPVAVVTDTPTPVVSKASAALVETDAPTLVAIETPATVEETDALAPIATEAPAAVVETDALASVATEAPAAVVKTDTLASVATEAPAAVVETDALASVATKAPAAVMKKNAFSPVATKVPLVSGERDTLAPKTTSLPEASVRTDALTLVVSDIPVGGLQTYRSGLVVTKAPVAVVEIDALPSVVTEEPAETMVTDVNHSKTMVTPAPLAPVETDSPTPVASKTLVDVVEIDTSVAPNTKVPSVETDASSSLTSETPVEVVEKEEPVLGTTKLQEKLAKSDAPQGTATEGPAAITTKLPVHSGTKFPAPVEIKAHTKPTIVSNTQVPVIKETQASIVVVTGGSDALSQPATAKSDAVKLKEAETTLLGSSDGARSGCKNAFTLGTNGQCKDIDECADGSHLCHEDHVCMNFAGGYRCVCKRGFRMRDFDRKCMDINECKVPGATKCHHNCINTYGSFKCTCRAGYRLVPGGKRCKQVNRGGSVISSAAGCFMFHGRKLCYCLPSFKWNMHTQACEKMDDENSVGTAKGNKVVKESDVKLSTTAPPVTAAVLARTTPRPVETTIAPLSSKCPKYVSAGCHYQCEVLRKGLYHCKCPQGYEKGHYGICRDVNECWSRQRKCFSPDSSCFNTYGSYKCVSFKCPDQFRKFKHGYCEKPCQPRELGYCRMEYVRYHTVPLFKGLKVDTLLVTLRVQRFLLGQVKRTVFFFKEKDSRFKLKVSPTSAELLTAQKTEPGSGALVIMSHVYDNRDRLICVTKFIVYYDIGLQKF